MRAPRRPSTVTPVRRNDWVIVARACVIVALGGFEAIHVGGGVYLPLGLGVVAFAVGVGGYAVVRLRGLPR